MFWWIESANFSLTRAQSVALQSTGKDRHKKRDALYEKVRHEQIPERRNKIPNKFPKK